MKWQQLILVFIASISLIFAGNALAQTDININNTNLIRFGGSVIVPENQVVENALAFGGSVTVSPNARVFDLWLWIGYGFVFLEGITLLTFKFVCPLTLIARKYSNSTKDNFDIYLPNWLAKYTK